MIFMVKHKFGNLFNIEPIPTDISKFFLLHIDCGQISRLLYLYHRHHMTDSVTKCAVHIHDEMYLPYATSIYLNLCEYKISLVWPRQIPCDNIAKKIFFPLFCSTFNGNNMSMSMIINDTFFFSIKWCIKKC